MPTDATLTESDDAAEPAWVDGEVVKNALLRSLFGRDEWTKVGRFGIRERVGAGAMARCSPLTIRNSAALSR